MVTLVKRTVVKGRAYAATDVDSPGSGALAVAVASGGRWRVARQGGAVVGDGLDERRAVALMLRTAAGMVDSAALRAMRLKAA